MRRTRSRGAFGWSGAVGCAAILGALVLGATGARAQDGQTIGVCVIHEGVLQYVEAEYHPVTGDTTVGAMPFSKAYPVGYPSPYASRSTWYINNETVEFAGGRYQKYGLPRVLGVDDVGVIGVYSGVGVYAEPGSSSGPEIIYIPVRPGCEFQPYQRAEEIPTVEPIIDDRPPAALLAETLSMFSPAVLERVRQLGYRPAARLLHETFDDNRAEWCTASENGDRLVVRGGRYHMRDGDGSRWCRSGQSTAHDDVLFRAEITYEAGHPRSGGAIFFRNSGWDGPRPFVVVDAAEESGFQYEVGYFDSSRAGDSWVDLVDWTASSAVRAGTNVVEVVVVGRTLSLFLNGTFIRSIAGLPNTRGEYLGLAVLHDSMEYSFDNVMAVTLEPGA